MSVSHVTGNPGAGQSGWNAKIREVRQEFHQLFKAVRSGEQVEQQAQTTTAALQQLQPATQTVSSGSDTANVGERSVGSVNSDIGALRQALRSGDSAAAQHLLTQLQQDVQSISLASAHGSRHNHFGGMAPQAPSYPAETPAAPGDASIPATTTEEPAAPVGTTDETAMPVAADETAPPAGTAGETTAPVASDVPAVPVEAPAAVAGTPTEPAAEPVAAAPSSEAPITVPATPDATVAIGTVPADPVAAIISSIEQPEPVVVLDTPVIDTMA